MEWHRYKGELRTIDGELPHGCPWNHHWAIGQGEPHYPPGCLSGGPSRIENLRRDHLNYWTDFTITLIPLNNGKWQARPIKSDVLFMIDTAPQFDTREAALRRAVAEIIRRARRRSRPHLDPHWKKGHGLSYWHLRPEVAQELIDWARGLLALEPLQLFVAPPPPPPPPPEKTGQLELFEP